MKTGYKLFFAIPFDSATKNLYERVRNKITKRYPYVTIVIGNQEVGPSPIYSNIVSFKAQNRELNKQFVAQIREADIVIADLTHNNPNVHVELGIALMENKNILRVTGRSISELGFDIQNLEVLLYKDDTQLTKIIMEYLDMFFIIKKLQISNEFPALYCKEPELIHLVALPPTEFIFQSNCPSNFMMRDGAVRVNFEILEASSPYDWFGIYLRAAAYPPMASHLVYVRQNGMIEIAVYPGPHVLKTLETGQAISGRHELTVQFENDYIEVQMGEAKLQYDKLSHQAVGRIFPAAFKANVDVHSVEMICRDTIEYV
jgi:aromatic ring-cleaving dioxygenase